LQRQLDRRLGNGISGVGTFERLRRAQVAKMLQNRLENSSVAARMKKSMALGIDFQFVPARVKFIECQ